VGPTGLQGVAGAAGVITDAKKVTCNLSCSGVVCEENTLTCTYDETSGDAEPPVICVSSPTVCSTPVCVCI
jgi:hypothetical protein